MTLLTGLAAGLVMSTLSFSCGTVVENEACAADGCPPGPEGPEGPAGPPGPAGPGFGTCKRVYQNPCPTGVGVECTAICPAGMYVVSGGCDITFNGAISESMPGFASGDYPPPVSPFDAWDRWSCSTNAGDVQTTHALCCMP